MKERVKIGLLSVFTIIVVWVISPSMTAYAFAPHDNDFLDAFYVLTYTQLIVGKVMSIAIPVLLLVFGILWIVKICKACKSNLALRIIGVIVLQLVFLCLLESGVIALALTFAHNTYSSGDLGKSHILFFPFYYYMY